MSSKLSIVREWIAIALDSIAPCGALSMSRHWIPSRASSCAMTNPVGPVPTISTFVLSPMPILRLPLDDNCRLVDRVPIYWPGQSKLE